MSEIDHQGRTGQSVPHNRSGPEGGGARGSGFSRRDFLKGTGAAVAATAVATRPQEAAAQQRRRKNVVPAEPTPVTLNVNGRSYTVKVEPRVTLLEVLRNDLNLTGAKDVDETSAAGADTVLLDGKPALAGSVYAHECKGRRVTTVESLRDEDGEIDDVIKGFVKYDALQCGFCTPGFVMAVRGFLNHNPKASDEHIRKGLGGNICRCGTYQGIMKCAVEIARKGGVE